MKVPILALSAFSVMSIWSGLAVAADTALPTHKEVCVSGVVSKSKLAFRLLAGIRDELKLGDLPAPSDPKYGPELWRRIIADPKFCENSPACKKIKDDDEDLKAFHAIDQQFSDLLITGSQANAYSAVNLGMTRFDYFVGPDGEKAITCTANDIVVKPKPGKDTSSFRIRANSDDLFIDRNDDKATFKTLDKSSFSLTGDGVNNTLVTKATATVGYAFGTSNSEYFTTIVPFVSVDQSITHTDGSARKVNDGNNVTVGLGTESLFVSGDTLAHHIAATPQFLMNTRHDSRIAGLHLTYAPWTFFPGNWNLNTAGTFNEAGLLVRPLFDLRSISGVYTDRGDLTVAARNTNFERLGSKFGFGISTQPGLPPLSLNITETFLYGAAGEHQRLSLFESAASYDFSSYVGLRLSYKNGRDQDTAELAQTWTLGLAAKY